MQAATSDVTDGNDFLRLPEVKKMIGLSRATIYRMIEKGEFPRPVKQGRTSSWPKGEVDAYRKSVVEARQ